MPPLSLSFLSPLDPRCSVGQAQESIEGGLQRRRRGVLGPQECCVACVFVDDLNMPAPEASGAQPPVELLRQVRWRCVVLIYAAALY